jgi:phosphoribosylformylglycinamidine synthase
MPLSDYEKAIIRKSLGREPTQAEWLVFEAEWSEHCSYKSSRRFLKLLPSEAPHVLRGPGLDAPLIRVGNLMVSFKIESHNHPSAVDPYDGAATGVGGIVRDILTVGLRPIALMDNLHFGLPNDPHSRWIARNVMKGISDYGNRIGVPVVAGEVWFDESFTTNPIVLVTCVGVGRLEDAVMGETSPGDLVLVIGNDVGKDGMLGSSFASKVLDRDRDDIGAVQVGNPLLEKLLIDAIIELRSRRLIKAIKDVGGGGLATALSELADQFGLGIEIHLDRVRTRERMAPEEVLVSESQERMVIVVGKDRLSEVEEVLRRYGVGYDIIGVLTNDGKFTAYYGNDIVADLPIKLITHAPETNYSIEEPEHLSKLRVIPELPEVSLGEALIKVLSSPNIASKEPVFSLYDYEVGVRTVIKPGGAGAAVLRLLDIDGGDGKLGIAVKADANPRYSFLDPFIGAANSLAKAYRNVVAVGAEPLAAVDSINVGNPEKPERYWYFVNSVLGLAWIARELNIPIVGGKVSFYNEDSNGNVIKPVVAVAVIGRVDDVTKAVDGGLVGDGYIVTIGKTSAELGGSEYLHAVHGIVRGIPPRPRPKDEVRNSRAILKLIQDGLVSASMDIGIGGLLTTLSKMALINGVGFNIDLSKVPVDDCGIDPTVIAFSETNARYVIEVKSEHLDKAVSTLTNLGVPFSIIGRAGGDAAVVHWGHHELMALRLNELETAYNSLWGVL